MIDVDLFGEPVATAAATPAPADWLPGLQAAVIADGLRRQDARVLEHAAVMGDVLEGDVPVVGVLPDGTAIVGDLVPRETFSSAPTPEVV